MYKAPFVIKILIGKTWFYITHKGTATLLIERAAVYFDISTAKTVLQGYQKATNNTSGVIISYSEDCF